ncbi:MAG: hypothetical protein ACP5IY_00095 [Halothiobacillaceae bacterium]
MMSAPHTLASDTYRLMLTPSGAGEARRGELQLNRWHGDTLEDDLGLFIYLRDAKSGAFWSIGHQPVPDADGTECGHAFGEGFACFVKRGHGIEACMTVWVDGDRELRRIRLKNLGEKSRRIELTSYLEPVLHHPAADAGHPAFAKLFVQTEAVMEHAALLARRRPRGADERFPWLVHGLLDAQISGFETDRMRFIGRGRSLAAPRAKLDAGLSGTAGNVLDPCMALRTQIELAPGQEADALFVLGVAEDREAALALLAEPVGASLRPDVALARIHPPAALARPATQRAPVPCLRTTAPNCCSSRTAMAASMRMVPNMLSACRARPMARLSAPRSLGPTCSPMPTTRAASSARAEPSTASPRTAASTA